MFYPLLKQVHGLLDEVTTVGGGRGCRVECVGVGGGVDLFIAATAIKPPKAACHFAAGDILWYELCYYIVQWIFISPIRKEKRRNVIILPTYQAIERIGHKELSYTMVLKTYLRTWTTQNKDRIKERRSKYAVQLSSSLMRTNSVKVSVRSALVTALLFTIFNGFCLYLYV